MGWFGAAGVAVVVVVVVVGIVSGVGGLDRVKVAFVVDRVVVSDEHIAESATPEEEEDSWLAIPIFAGLFYYCSAF